MGSFLQLVGNYVMENQIIITSASFNNIRKLFSVVDIELHNKSEANGAIIEIIDGRAKKLLVLDKQIIDFFMHSNNEHIYILTADSILLFDGKEVNKVYTNLKFGLYKKFWGNKNSIYLLTKQDLLVEIDMKGLKGKEISLDISTSISIEGAVVNESGIKYLVGWQGFIAERKKNEWVPIEAPTNTIINSITETDENIIVAVGLKGTVISGKGEEMSLIDHDWLGYDFWDVIQFNDTVFILGEEGVFNITDENLVEPVIGRPQNKSIFFKFVSFGRILWAVGEKNILEFDGNSWNDLIKLD